MSKKNKKKVTTVLIDDRFKVYHHRVLPQKKLLKEIEYNEGIFINSLVICEKCKSSSAGDKGKQIRKWIRSHKGQYVMAIVYDQSFGNYTMYISRLEKGKY